MKYDLKQVGRHAVFCITEPFNIRCETFEASNGMTVQSIDEPELDYDEIFVDGVDPDWGKLVTLSFGSDIQAAEYVARGQVALEEFSKFVRLRKLIQDPSKMLKDGSYLITDHGLQIKIICTDSNIFRVFAGVRVEFPFVGLLMREDENEIVYLDHNLRVFNKGLKITGFTDEE